MRSGSGNGRGRADTDADVDVDVDGGEAAGTSSAWSSGRANRCVSTSRFVAGDRRSATVAGAARVAGNCGGVDATAVVFLLLAAGRAGAFASAAAMPAAATSSAVSSCSTSSSRAVAAATRASVGYLRPLGGSSLAAERRRLERSGGAMAATPSSRATSAGSCALFGVRRGLGWLAAAALSLAAASTARERFLPAAAIFTAVAVARAALGTATSGACAASGDCSAFSTSVRTAAVEGSAASAGAGVDGRVGAR
jgi:hypothetical protein